jgi:hypothetical protein
MESTVKKIQLVLFVGLSALVFSSLAEGRGIGLKFAATDPDAATSSLLPAEIAGVVPQANWNNLEGANGTNVGSLELDNGAASTATVSWSSPNTWRSTTGNNAFPAGPDRKLTAGYLDSTDLAAGGAMVTVNNIDASVNSPRYDVIVYFVSDSGANRGGAYTLTPSVGAPQVKYGSTLAMPAAYLEDPGTDTDLSLDGTHVRFRGLTGSSFSIASNTELTTPNGFRAPINAIQIIAVPEPASILVACLAALVSAVAWRRRNR